MDKEWKLGDVVRLASGGPDMTVQYVNSKKKKAPGQEMVACVWFDKDGILKENSFPAGALVAAK